MGERKRGQATSPALPPSLPADGEGTGGKTGMKKSPITKYSPNFSPVSMAWSALHCFLHLHSPIHLPACGRNKSGGQIWEGAYGALPVKGMEDPATPRGETRQKKGQMS